MIVACARGLDGGPDDVSYRLVPSPLARVLRRTLRLASFGLSSHISARTVFIDAVVRRTTAKQVVVLGAGLDARAHRLAELAEAVVFEVDQPSTQDYKRARAASLPRCAKALRYVAVDFERDDLAERLATAGHDATAPTTWIWEGVTMYLTEAAVAATLDIVRARSTIGSELVLTYGLPGLANASKPLFAVIREPLRTLFTRERMATVAAEHGFEIAAELPPSTMIAEVVSVLRAR